MKKVFYTLLTTMFFLACSSENERNMIVKGQIKGLKKGTLYLQKMKDTLLVTVDSVSLLGKDTFTLTDNVTSPVMYYLTFNGNTEDKRLLFFGEKGEITINDKLEEFGYKPEITGSKNQEVLDKFQKVENRFTNQNLELIKKELEAKQQNDTVALKEVAADYKKMTRRKLLFATNFAIGNANTEAAPYIALTKLYDANIQLLDTVNNSLTDRVKKSVYGVRLQEFIDKIKAVEKK
ncbi:DUF4369 domain-containing protein [Tenacibaculum sp. SG-28]|uniref:DUF4369 domain-containing protein n=1 Tax=Tenacibaculum sp. SG-28 TaxID=754426 RepID=UPI000CF4CB70|nr:DUF4369 domain-containing protein [Tenacibaculum sp. SG-28]PQJ22888.1 thiol:disulfide interchange protein [Tenacibaculum sp. SG-28]